MSFDVEKSLLLCVIGVLLLGEDVKFLHSIIKEASVEERSRGSWLSKQKSVVLIERNGDQEWFFDVRDNQEQQPAEVYISSESVHCSCSIDVAICRHVCASIEALNKNNFLIENEITVSYFLILKSQGWVAVRGILGEDTFHEISTLNEYVVNERHRTLDDFFKKYRGDVLNKEKILCFFKSLNQINQDVFVVFNSNMSFKDAGCFKPKGTPVLPHVVVADKINGEQLDGFEVFLVRNPQISQVLGGGVVICDKEIGITSRGELSEFGFRSLNRGIVFGYEDVEVLVTKQIPELQNILPVNYLPH